ncbi:MAG: winged helix-turn-helix domain-containing protein [Desulfurella sp.]
MKEYIVHLLQQQKSISFNDLLKKTNLNRERLLKAILSLVKENNVYFMNLSSTNNNNCFTCSAKILCKKRR